MEKLILIKPTLDWKTEILAFRDEFSQLETGIDGTSWLASAESIETWLHDLKKYEQATNLTDGYVPALQFLFIRENERKIIGMLNFRLKLNDYLLNYGGHIGYAIVPSEQQKGYGTKQLAAAVEEARKLKFKKLLLTCSDHNTGSIKIIEKNHGVLENKVANPDVNGLTRRYWITLS